MLSELLNQGMLIYIIAGVCLLGLLSEWIHKRLYRRLMKESALMATSKNKLIRQIRLKFENSFRANSGMDNVRAFVDKYIYQHKFMGIRLHGWNRFSAAAAVLCAVIGGIGAALHYYLSEAIEDTYVYAGAVGISLALLGVGAFLFSASYAKQVTIANILDYLENNVSRHLRVECDAEADVKAERRRQLARKKLNKKENEQFDDQVAAAVPEQSVKKNLRRKSVDADIEQMKKSLEQIAAENADNYRAERMPLKEEQQAIIEEVLREYLT